MVFTNSNQSNELTKDVGSGPGWVPMWSYSSYSHQLGLCRCLWNAGVVLDISTLFWHRIFITKMFNKLKALPNLYILVLIFLTVSNSKRNCAKFYEGISSSGTIFKVSVNSMRCWWNAKATQLFRLDATVATDIFMGKCTWFDEYHNCIINLKS